MYQKYSQITFDLAAAVTAIVLTFPKRVLNRIQTNKIHQNNTTNKKVLFTSHTANFQKFNHPFMKWFKQQGYEVHYASMGEEPIKHADKSYKVSFNRSPYSLDNVRAYRPLKKIINDQRYEIIHTHTPMGSVVTRLSAKKARKKYGTKVIYTAHGFHFFKGAPLQNWLMFYPTEKLMARYTDTLITINEEDYLLASKKFRTTTEYVPGVGVDSNKFGKALPKSKRTAIKHAIGLKANDRVILYVAELSLRKRQLWLIESLKDLIQQDKSIHLMLTGMDSLNGQCEELAKELKIQDNVHILGYRNDIPDLMAIADISVSTSSQEGLPVGIMESMFMGIPVIATDCRGNRDLIQDGQNGYLVDLDDQTSFATKIQQLFNSTSDSNNLVKNGTTFIQQFSLKSILEYMRSIYGLDAFQNNIATTVSPTKQPKTLNPVLSFYAELPTKNTATTNRVRKPRGK